MWRIDLPCAPGAEELALARFLPYDLAAADSETPALARAWFAAHHEALRCAADLGPTATIHKEPDDDWNAPWQQSEWRARTVGQKLWLAPPWDPEPAPRGRIRLDMHPGTLFGNGDHPTTLLCLEALERHVINGASIVADIGCGSGLIGQAAGLLGAKLAIGCDLDPQAAHAAAGTAFQGSVDAIASGSIDVLVANIQVGVLLQLLPEIRRVLRPETGVAILSGILVEQLEEWPVKPSRTADLDGWACLEVGPQMGVL